MPGDTAQRQCGGASIHATSKSFRIGIAGSGVKVRGPWSTRATQTSPPPSIKGTPSSVALRANGGCASRADEANGSSFHRIGRDFASSGLTTIPGMLPSQDMVKDMVNLGATWQPGNQAFRYGSKTHNARA